MKRTTAYLPPSWRGSIIRLSFLSWLAPAIVVGQATPVAVDSARVLPRASASEPVVMRVGKIDATQVGIGRSIRVEIVGLREAIRRDGIDPTGFVLYLGGYPLWNVRGQVVSAARGIVEFRLQRADTSHAAWVGLLGRPTSLVRRNVAVGVGYRDQVELDPADPNHPPTVTLTVMDSFRLIGASVLLLVLVGGFLSLAKKSNIVRDASPPEPPLGTNKPYSLAKLQMAVWFFLVIGAFTFLNLITDGVDTLNQQALILIGIGTLTALGSTLVDASKRGEKEAKLAELKPAIARLDAEVRSLAPLTAPENATAEVAAKKVQLELVSAQVADIENTRNSPVSTGFFNDILTDASGISLHRFQMLAWTAILGMIFIYQVWERLAMPEFSGTLLSLMGISAGTYLGFKVPEREG